VTKPDYQQRSIVNLMSSLVQGLGGPAGLYPPLDLLPPATVAAATNVVLLVIDGLGYRYLRRHGNLLNACLRGKMTTVFPSSTAPAITSFLTGVAPQQHGVTGWFMHLRELGTVAMMLPFRSRWGGDSFASAGVKPGDLLACPPLVDSLNVRSYFLISRELVHSPFTAASAGKAKRIGYRNLVDLAVVIDRLVRQGSERQYLYVYWPLFDALAHDYGVGSRVVKRHLRELERWFTDLTRELEGTDTLLVATADHGFIDTAPTCTVTLQDHPELAACLALPLCGEPRLAYCYVRPGKTGRFERYVRERFGDWCDLYPSEELVQQGWFGLGEPAPQLLERIGDYVLMLNGSHVIQDLLIKEKAHHTIGVHGGASEDEMMVPLLVADC